MVALIALPMLAVLLALALGGSLAGWARHGIAWWQLAAAALAVQLVLYNPPLDEQPWAIAWGPAIWIASIAAMLLVLARNGMVRGPGRPAWWIATLGTSMNLAVVTFNGGYMPRATDHPSFYSAASQLTNVVPLGEHTQLAWLADVIQQPAWLPLANVLSIGDVLLAGGLAWWVFAMTMSGRTRAFSLRLSSDSAPSGRRQASSASDAR
ncbi:MAG TPA: DUF5317 family protein [Chloroflexota bacterium]|jgi:hypothetical protein